VTGIPDKPYGAGAVAIGGVKLHQAAITVFAERIMQEQALTVADGQRIVVLLIQHINQPDQSIAKKLVQRLAKRKNPVIVTVREQIASVVSHRCL
jgi:hypothetical protein